MTMKDCRIDYMTNTVTMTKKFYEKATRPGTPEYGIYKTLCTDFPHMRPIIKPSPKKNAATRNRMTYQQMINYIDCLPDRDSLKRIEETLGTRFQAKLKISGRINKNLSDDEIDQITQSATIDEGFESFSFSESIDEEKEVIDIIKKQAYLSRTIQLTEAEREQSDVIWSRIRSCFN